MGSDTNSDNIAEAFFVIGELAEQTGATPLNKHEGCWTYAIDKWSIKLNAHREVHDGVPPFHALVTWADMPAMLVTSVGGVTLGGGDPEGDFIGVVRAEIKRLAEMSGGER